jgi:hypothetical protein
VFDAWYSSVQCRDQLLQITREIKCAHGHLRAPLGSAPRREAFQISPQPPHRQYVFSSGFRAVVVIEDDLHAGHAVGVVAAAGDRYALPLPKSGEFIGLQRT